MPMGKGNHPGANTTYKSDVMAGAAKAIQGQRLGLDRWQASQAAGYKYLEPKETHTKFKKIGGNVSGGRK